ncbi:MAG: hypothetical protein DRZ76_03175 [Candidatus Nealsonbacteria bacterium]|nr:MAG: hypothetical protein DRZ76_03175 [Candidatus Nealsonbacteria bacterium]
MHYLVDPDKFFRVSLYMWTDIINLGGSTVGATYEVFATLYAKLIKSFVNNNDFAAVYYGFSALYCGRDLNVFSCQRKCLHHLTKGQHILSFLQSYICTIHGLPDGKHGTFSYPTL